MLWVLGGVAVLALVGAIYLSMTLSRNGPALLSAVDRVAGGDQGAAELATIATGDHPAQKLHVWGPATRDPTDAPLPVFLFVHGGGWRSGDPVAYGYFGRAFVPEGFVVVLAGYRLGEDGVYPGMLEDTADAIAWTHAEIAKYGGDPDRIVIAGHSAGAYNVVGVALDDQWLTSRGLSGSDIAGVIGISGPYDFAPFKSDSTIAAFGHVEDAASTQPINHVRPDAPPMLLINGEQDELVGARNARLLAERLNEAGGTARAIVPETMNHNDPIIAFAAPWRSDDGLFREVADFALTVTAQTSVPVQDETR